MTTNTFPLDGSINLDCRLGVGALEVTAVDDLGEATVTLTARESGSDIVARTRVELDGRTLVVRGPKGGHLPLFGGRADHDALDVSITVPSGTAMKLSSLATDTTVRGRAGSVHVAAGAAAIVLDEVDGDLRAHFASGPVRVASVTGSASVKYGAGEARLGEIGKSLDLACASGDVTVDRAHGSVRLRTGSGTATIGAAEADLELLTGAGAFAIGLPSGVTARLDITTGSGQVHSELPVEHSAPGGPTITIRARTGHGDVRLFRTVEATA